MTRPNLVSRISALAPRRRSVVVVLLVLVAFGLGVVFATAQSGADSLAWWWPAVGAAAAAALSADRRWMPLVVVAAAVLTGVASVLAGRPWLVVVAGVIGTALELLIIVGGVARRGGTPTLSTARDVGRFLLTAAVASATIALLIAGASAVGGVDATARFFGAAASHLSALLLIVPLVLIDRSSARVGRWWQTLLLTLGLLAAVFLAFGPIAPAPLAFLPVPLLAWAAFSQTMAVAMGQVLLAVGVASTFTAAGFGPFAGQLGVLPTPALLQIYAVAISATCLIIAAQRGERQALEDRQDALVRLLRDAFARSRTGFAVVRVAESGELTVIEANGVAGDLLGPQLALTDGRWRIDEDSALHRMLHEVEDAVRTHESSELGRSLPPSRLWIDPIRRPEMGRTLLVTVEDLRPVRAVEQAMSAQLERERRISEALRELNAKQDAFVASVSHELRTPVTSIVGYAQELEEEISDPDHRAYLEVITRNAERLAGLVENALRAATIRQQPVGVHGATVVDLAQIVGDCLADLRYRIDDRAVRIVRDLADETPVRADAAELGQIVSNLLTNAIKFSPRGGTVEVVVARIGHSVTVEISDDGPGIAEPDQARVFERFYRSPQAIADGVPGTGIGLSVAQGLAGAMGGAIVLSGRDGGGTSATLRLPLAVSVP